MTVVIYDSNNSGGYWWLSTSDWEALEEAGWNVHWVQRETYGYGRPKVSYDDPLAKVERDPEGSYLGCIAASAAKKFDNPEDAIKEFESITGQDASAQGCNCCGPPHNFEYKDDEGKTHYATHTIVETRIEFT